MIQQTKRPVRLRTSDQPRHPPSDIKVFDVRFIIIKGPTPSVDGQWRLLSDWTAQADLSLCWMHMLVLSCYDSFSFNFRHRWVYRRSGRLFTEMYKYAWKLSMQVSTRIQNWGKRVQRYCLILLKSSLERLLNWGCRPVKDFVVQLIQSGDNSEFCRYFIWSKNGV